MSWEVEPKHSTLRLFVLDLLAVLTLGIILLAAFVGGAL